MRRYLLGGLAAATLMMVGVVSAQAQCALCGIGGFFLGSALSGDGIYESNGTIIYTAPRIAERLTDPLEVKFGSTYKDFRYQPDQSDDGAEGMTIRQLFVKAIERDESKFEILEVMRVVDAGDVANGAIWFAYIERSKIKPLQALPPMTH